MKKPTAFLGALLLSSAFMAPVSATETQDITTTDGSATPEATIYGTLSGEVKTQMKFTLPIKIEFAVAPKSTMLTDDAPAEANRLFIGDYKLKVAADSDIGIHIQTVAIENIGDWTLDFPGNVDALSLNKTEALAAPEKAKTVSLRVFDSLNLFYGTTGVSDDVFVVPIGGEKSFGYSGSAGKVWLDQNLGSGTQEQAFKVKYLVARY